MGPSSVRKRGRVAVRRIKTAKTSVARVRLDKWARQVAKDDRRSRGVWRRRAYLRPRYGGSDGGFWGGRMSLFVCAVFVFVFMCCVVYCGELLAL